MGEKRKAYRLLMRKPKGKRLSGRPISMWIDNIKMDLGEIQLGGMDFRVAAHLVATRVVLSCTELVSY
jgi:hypothetical protein